MIGLKANKYCKKPCSPTARVQKKLKRFPKTRQVITFYVNIKEEPAINYPCAQLQREAICPIG